MLAESPGFNGCGNFTLMISMYDGLVWGSVAAVFPFTVENGKVTSVTVKVADFIEYNPYEFKKRAP